MLAGLHVSQDCWHGRPVNNFINMSSMCRWECIGWQLTQPPRTLWQRFVPHHRSELTIFTLPSNNKMALNADQSQSTLLTHIPHKDT